MRARERSVAYQSYLESDLWERKRDAIMARAHGRCETPGCGARAVDVHHLTYRRIYRERREDLMALCDRCHQRAHGIILVVDRAIDERAVQDLYRPDRRRA